MFEKWPYTNFHDLNLDWIMKQLGSLKESMDSAASSAESAARSAATAETEAGRAESYAESASAEADKLPAAFNNLEMLRQQIDNIIPEGTQTEGNTELIDIRSGANGINYSSAGDAVRGQYTWSVHPSGRMITGDESAAAQINSDCNNMVPGVIYTIGASLNIANLPYNNFRGVVVNFSHLPTAPNGRAQLAFGSTGRLLYRICWGATNVWSAWQEVSRTGTGTEVYYVGGSSQYQSLTALFQQLAGNENEKIIYINPGVYDIFQEYRDAGIPAPPDDVSASDYLTRCVFLPPNTSLIGIGDVTLQWTPEDGQITYGEARTWSPLNIRYACHVENITIRCNRGRYCIHDDSHNSADDQGVTHIYKNVRCYYTYNASGFGFNDVTGFGFSQKNKYIFDSCTFQMIGAQSGGFYGHGVSGNTQPAIDSPHVELNHCIMTADGSGTVCRLQSLNTGSLHIITRINGCHIGGVLRLQPYDNTRIQAFDVTLCRSGAPALNVPTVNPYPVKIYE